MSDTSNEVRTYSEYEIQRFSWDPETRKTDIFMRDLPALQKQVQRLKRNGRLNACTLETMFYLTALNIEMLKEVFYELDMKLVDWDMLAKIYTEE